MFDGKENKQGLFAVKINAVDGKVSAVLTGQHFDADEADVAKAILANEEKESVVNGGSPIYLVRDSVVRVATGAYAYYLKCVLSTCHDGPKGKACGKCKTCKDAQRDAFSWTVMSDVDLPETDLTARVVSAVGSVIGRTWADAPWSKPMDEEEVEEVFNKLGVKPVKEGEE